MERYDYLNLGQSGLDRLAAGQPQPPQPPGPPNPYNHAKVQKALDIIEQNPGISVQMMQTIMGEALGPVQAQIDQRQAAGTQAFDTASQGLMGLATSGYGTPQGLEALTGAYQSMSPSLNKPKYAGQLEGLQGSLGALSETVPSAVAEGGPEPLNSEDFATIDGDVQKWASGEVKGPNGMPMGLHEAVLAHVQPLRAQGYSEEDLAKVQAYITQRWQYYQGPERPQGGY